MTVQWQRFAKGTLVAPVHSPFSAGGGATAACASIAGQARYLVAEGFNAVFVCGTNGESFSCSLAERKAMLEMWMSTEEVRAKKLRVLAHVSCLAPPETVELARHAAALGVLRLARWLFYGRILVDSPCSIRARTCGWL